MDRYLSYHYATEVYSPSLCWQWFKIPHFTIEESRWCITSHCECMYCMLSPEAGSTNSGIDDIWFRQKCSRHYSQELLSNSSWITAPKTHFQAEKLSMLICHFVAHALPYDSRVYACVGHFQNNCISTMYSKLGIVFLVPRLNNRVEPCWSIDQVLVFLYMDESTHAQASWEAHFIQYCMPPWSVIHLLEHPHYEWQS